MSAASPPPPVSTRPRTAAFVGCILRFRWALIFVAALLSGLAALGAARVGVDNAIEVWFLEDDPALQAYREFQRSFGNDEVVAIAVHQEGGILDEAGMARLERIGAAAAAVPGVADVDSLATVERIESGEDWLEVSPLARRPLPPDFRARVLSDPLYTGRLVNRAGDTALVLARMEAMGDIDARRDAILAALREAVEATGEDPAWAGIGVIYAALNQASTRDSAGFVIGSYLAILAALAWLLRRPAPVLLSLGVVGVGALWTMGLYGALGRDVNMVTMVLTPLMLIVGVSDCVHFLHRAAELPPGGTRWERARTAVALVFWPCLLNSVTTAAGFAALAFSPMLVLRDLGLFAAFGVCGTFLASLLGSAVGLLSARVEPPHQAPGLVEALVERCCRAATDRPGRVLLGALGLLLLGAWGITRLDADTYSIDYLRRSHPVRQDSDAIERGFGPYTPLEFVVEADDALHDPAVLGAVARWQDAIAREGAAGWSASAADVVRRLEQVLSDGRPESFRVPEDPARLEQALLLYTSDPDADLSRWVSADGRRLRVTAGIPMASARGIRDAIARIQALAPPELSVTPSGYLPLYVRIMDAVVSSQAASFSSAFLVIFVVIGLLLRSPRLAILAVPPNVLPIVLTLGIMGIAGIRLDVATVTIAAILLGLVVDDTVQLLWRYREEFRVLQDHRLAVEAAIRGVGRAMVGTAVVFSLGFAVLGFASIKSVAWFGVLMSLSMLTAVLGDLLVLPALIVLVRPRA